MTRDDHCFCCGIENNEGLHLSFSYPERGVAESDLQIPVRFSGWKDITHGGFLSMLLDEVMAHALLSAGINGMTAELSVRFRTPVTVGERVLLRGEIESDRTRICSVAASVSLPDGTSVATGTGRFLVDPKSAAPAPKD